MIVFAQISLPGSCRPPTRCSTPRYGRDDRLPRARSSRPERRAIRVHRTTRSTDQVAPESGPTGRPARAARAVPPPRAFTHTMRWSRLRHRWAKQSSSASHGTRSPKHAERVHRLCRSESGDGRGAQLDMAAERAARAARPVPAGWSGEPGERLLQAPGRPRTAEPVQARASSPPPGARPARCRPGAQAVRAARDGWARRALPAPSPEGPNCRPVGRSLPQEKYASGATNVVRGRLRHHPAIRLRPASADQEGPVGHHRRAVRPNDQYATAIRAGTASTEAILRRFTRGLGGATPSALSARTGRANYRVLKTVVRRR